MDDPGLDAVLSDGLLAVLQAEAQAVCRGGREGWQDEHADSKYPEQPAADRWNDAAMTSMAPASWRQPKQTITPTPIAVRRGASRRRSRTRCAASSRVMRLSIPGYSAAAAKVSPSSTTDGQNGAGTVYLPKCTSHAGHSRTAPSSQPKYQGGVDPAAASAESAGPYSQIGLT